MFKASSFLISNLAWCHYGHTSKLYLETCLILWDPIIWAIASFPKANAAVNCVQWAKAKKTKKPGVYIKIDWR